MVWWTFPEWLCIAAASSSDRVPRFISPTIRASPIQCRGWPLTAAEYDRHFGLDRGDPDLAEWSRSCLRVLEAQREDMHASSLAVEEKLRITEGMCIVFELVLERWVEAGARP